MEMETEDRRWNRVRPLENACICYAYNLYVGGESRLSLLTWVNILEKGGGGQNIPTK